MTRLTWDGPRDHEEGVDRGVLYLDIDRSPWEETFEDGPIGGTVSVDNTDLYRVEFGTLEPKPIAIFSNNSRVGSKSLFLSSETPGDVSGFRTVTLTQLINAEPYGKVSLWINLDDAFGHWGRFDFHFHMTDGAGEDPYGHYIINTFTYYDPELDDMVNEYRVGYESNFTAGGWGELAVIDLHAWYKLEMEWGNNTMTFRIYDEDEIPIASETVPCDSTVGTTSGETSFGVTTYDPLNKIAIYIDGFDTTVSKVSETNTIAVPWHGLVSVDEKDTSVANEDHYFDGQKIRISQILGDYSATVEAITYPEGFELYDGTIDLLTSQVRKTFAFTYRTKKGEGHLIHLVYGATASPSSKEQNSVTDDPSLSNFVWDISAKPVSISEEQKFTHLIIDTNEVTNSSVIDDLEYWLYGNDEYDPYLPHPIEIINLFEAYSVLRVTPNGDGTWTISGPDEMVSIDEDGIVTVIAPTVIEIDEDTYKISSY